ncbi:MAG TPA: hypothetical protein VFZ21_28620, partial [Gemmatimonadaceae bacterium]|nr:hypothetical protein [Gemmatimonadaceae bacterium]
VVGLAVRTSVQLSRQIGRGEVADRPRAVVAARHRRHRRVLRAGALRLRPRLEAQRLLPT